MGIGVGDYDLDGNLDIFKTHFADDTNVLYRNDGKGYFDDVTIRAGIGVETRYVGWGAGMVDLDNDGLPDLFLVTGSVYPEVEQTAAGLPVPDAAPGLPQSRRRPVRGADRRSRAAASPRRTPAAAARSATSTTTATSTSWS